jgi:amino acid adenylation domain-containing protein/FkbM family methyltransferase
MEIDMEDNARLQKLAIFAAKNIKEKNYWLNKLSGDLIKASFPYENTAAAKIPEYRPDSELFKIEGEIFTQLKKICGQSNQTLFVVLAAGLVILLNKYTNTNDITIGTSILKQSTGRKFKNTVLSLRNIVNDDMTFKDVLITAKTTFIEANENQNYPIETLLYQLNIDFLENGFFPLFDIIALFEGLHDRNYMKNIKTNMIFSFTKTSEFINCLIEYNTTLYKKETIKRIFGHYRQLFKEVLFHADLKLSSMNILTEREKELLLYEYNNTKKKYPREKTLQELFEKQAERIPDNIALSYEEQVVTYKLLDEKSNRPAHILRKKGVKRDNIVAIMSDRSIETLAAIIGIIKAGGAYLPLSQKYPHDRIRYILEDSSAVLVLTKETFFHRFESKYNVLDLIDPGLSAKTDETIRLKNINTSKDLSYVIYTSGSTGKPKGVMVEHQNVHNLVVGLRERIYCKYENHLRVCLVAPFEFDASVQQIFAALVLGHSLYIVPDQVRLNGSELLNFYLRYKIEISDGTPTHIRLLVDSLAGKTVKLYIKHFLTAGEEFPGKLVKRLLNSFKINIPNVSNIYGPTETCVDSTLYDIPGEHIDELPTIPIGKPLPNEYIYILDKENKLQPPGITGELYIGGDGAARGYLNRPELTAEKFDHVLWDYQYDHDKTALLSSKSYPRPYALGPRRFTIYKTGDLARWLYDGNLEFLGRMDHQVKLRGYRIELGEIENQLRSFEPVKGALVEIQQEAEGDERLAAYVEPDPVNAVMVRRILDLEEEGLGPGQQYHRFPGGMPIFYINLHEAENLYKEIFEEYSYWKHGISLADGACVLDIGANIGIFTLFVHTRYKDVQVYSIEPMPPAYEILQLNVRLHGIRAKVFNIGISFGDGEETFTYFPNSPGLSGRFTGSGHEINTARAFLLNRELDHDKGVALSTEQVDEIVKERLNTELITCPVKSLSALIRENGIEKIDLLKINVEKSEIDVLNGIEEQDWMKIQQVVMEVHNADGRLDGIRCRFETHEYNIVCEQDTLYKETKLYNLYAIRKDMKTENREKPGEKEKIPAKFPYRYTTPGQLISEMRTYLNGKLPDFMIPSFFILLNTFPLTANGKIDRKALPKKVSRHYREGYEAPVDEIEKNLVKIWSEVLRIDKKVISTNADFFDLGGHSLSAVMLITKMEKELSVKVPLVELFRVTTVRELAAYITSLAKTKYELIQPVEVKEYYPLSSAQGRFYILQQMYPDSLAYSSFSTFMLKGRLDREKFENALKKLIRRHESLRTSFAMINKDLVQKAHKYEEIHFEIDYFESSETAIRNIVMGYSKPFDLAQAPLFRLGIIKIEQQRHVFMFQMHHIVTDGVSMTVFVKDFSESYSGMGLPPLALQYKDFSRWQHERLTSGAFKKQEEYWMNLLSGDLPVLDMPTDFPRPAVQSFEGEELFFSLEKGLKEGLNRLMKETGTTLYMVLLTLLNVLLSKYTGQDDIIVGTPIAGRNHPDLQNIIGLLMETIVTRNYPGEDKIFESFLEEVRKNTLNAFENQAYPFGEVLKHFGSEMDASRNPLFDVMLIVQNIDADPGISNLGNIETAPYESSSQGVSRVDLTLVAVEEEEGINFSLEYCTKLFKKNSMEWFILSFRRLVETVVENKTIKLKDIKISHQLRAATVNAYEEAESEFEI